MSLLYTVDRLGTLKPGMVIQLQQHRDISPQYLQDHVDSLFPDGVSSHGERYFLQAGSKGNIASPAIELLFEYIRKTSFSNKPSRFESFFACESIDDAKSFRSQFGSHEQKIFEIQSDGPKHKCNMKLLHNDLSNLYFSYAAHQYWLGNQGISELGEFWEIILSLPVKVGDVVQ